ncbi:hypothetical protein CDV31_007120 [Fusarium ambrosium]|uniref:Uncharacterized protein n=1 Tax=Fusarium ambrosium TaxID=131363 RepID=A0A428U8C7_9HYPO|nr:hypothetical protein CDV31_007120 [Fusarium ambrosium]
MGCFCSKDSNASSTAAVRSRVDNDPGLVSGAGRYSERVPGRKPRASTTRPERRQRQESATTRKDQASAEASVQPIPNGNDRPPRPVRIKPRPQRSTLWSVGWRSVKGDKKAAQKRGSVNDDE